MPIILITGGSGRIGSMLRTRLARPGRTLRLLDITPPVSPGPDEQVVVASVTDMAAMTEACAGADAVIHLGGVAGEKVAETTDEDPARVALVADAISAYLLDAFKLSSTEWTALDDDPAASDATWGIDSK